MSVGATRILCCLMAIATVPANGARASATSSYVRAEIENRVALDTLGDCFMRTERRKIIAALTADPLTASFERWADGHSAHCYLDVMKKHGLRVRPQGATLQYVVAEAAFRRNLRSTHLTDLKMVPPLSQVIPEYHWRYNDPQSEAEKLADAENDRRALYFSILGECVVRANPEGSRQLLLATPWGEQEDSAFEALTSALSGCVDESQNVALNRQNLRGALALNYLRLEAALSRQSPPNRGVPR